MRTRSASCDRSRPSPRSRRAARRATPSQPASRVRRALSRGTESPGYPERTYRAATGSPDGWPHSPAPAGGRRSQLLLPVGGVDHHLGMGHYAVERVGGTGRRVNTRIVAATNRPLSGLVEKGLFHADLYYRLSGVESSTARDRDDALLQRVRAVAGSVLPVLRCHLALHQRSAGWLDTNRFDIVARDEGNLSPTPRGRPPGPAQLMAAAPPGRAVRRGGAHRSAATRQLRFPIARRSSPRSKNSSDSSFNRSGRRSTCS